MRTWTEIVKPYPELVRGKLYKVQVKNISKIAKPKALEINLEFLEAPQQGRCPAIQLPLPIRPGSLTASFFAACRLVVTPEARIAPRETVNLVIAASFEKSEDGRDWKPVDFKSIPEGEHKPITSQDDEPLHRKDLP